MSDGATTYVSEIQSIKAVPTILETVAAMTGLRFVCIAHVTATSWTTCAVLDKLSFGLKPGDELDVNTTLCQEVRESGLPVVIDSVRASDQYREHHTPAIYGFDSYFSVPIFRPGGEYFGTLCGLDPEQAPLSNPATFSTMKLFAQLVSLQLESESALADSRSALLGERETSELREQFIAVLGHDLRTPLGSILSGVDLLQRQHPHPAAAPVLERIRRSVNRMSALVDDVVDFTRGRMGGGIALEMRHEPSIGQVFEQIVEELRGMYPNRQIVTNIQPGLSLVCDAGRLAQMLSNLLKNALLHGSAEHPVRVAAHSVDGMFYMMVTNQGEELTARVTEQLFKPFWRASSEHPRDGLGLGLFIVAEIARSHGGAIDVLSAGGTTSFRFMLPVAEHNRALIRA
jgi:signal transduction histidine kinase